MTVDFFTLEFFIHICGILLLFSVGLFSGITLGLMSRSVKEFESLAKYGSSDEREFAAIILPVVRNQHLLFCTLVIWNLAAFEAIDSLDNAWLSCLILLISALLFGEIIPRSISSRRGLVIGALAVPFIRVLVWTSYPVASPVSKFLDFLLGHPHEALFPRAGNEIKLKAD